MNADRANQGRPVRFAVRSRFLVWSLLGWMTLSACFAITNDDFDESERSERSIDLFAVDRIVASEMVVLEVANGALSPDGRHFFGSTDPEDDSQAQLCLIDLDDLTSPYECQAGDPAAGFPVGSVPSFPRWAPDGMRVAWVSFGDVWAFEVASLRITGVTDDGLVDDSPDALGKVPRDTAPAWLDSETLAFFRFGPDTPLQTVLISDLFGRDQRLIDPPTYTTEFRGVETVKSEWQGGFLAPLISANAQIVVGTSGQVHSIDPSTGSVEVIGDYAEAYESVETINRSYGFQTTGRLFPQAETPYGHLLWDQAVWMSLNQGAWSGPPGGLYLLTSQSELIPLVEQSERLDGYLSGLAFAVSPSGQKVAVLWIDASDKDDAGAPTSRLSLIDLETMDLPVDIREVPLIWEGSGDFLWPGDPRMVWSSNDRIAVSGSDRTYVLQLVER